MSEEAPNPEENNPAEGSSETPEGADNTMTQYGSGIMEPPRTLGGVFKHLGPGLIIAGSIVGSGELIATTSTGAQAGYYLLWLIIIGCVIKVFAQVEFGRYTITHSKTSLDGMNEVPGPRVGKINWLVMYWTMMFVASLAQLGGIVGGVGQALAISAPISGDFNTHLDYEMWKDGIFKIEYKEQLDALTGNDLSKDEKKKRLKELEEQHHTALTSSTEEALEAKIKEYELEDKEATLNPEALKGLVAGENPYEDTTDDMIWAVVITLLTAIVLSWGRFGLIQSFSTVMVFGFTILTVVNVFALQTFADWAVSWEDIKTGLSFSLPPIMKNGKDPLVTALATFGIIGVGAAELVAYPYWCLEKGYAKYTGPNDKSEAWTERAKGWMHVLRWDAWASMVVYTFATIAFYVLGASVLHSSSSIPEGQQMIKRLGTMYEPVFGPTAEFLFLFGAFAVLYSTFFVANASHARVGTDAFGVFGILKRNEKNRLKSVRILSFIFPCVCLTFYTLIKAPAQLVLFSGLAQAVMLPMLAFAALYFRYRRCEEELQPGKVWDIFLWISGAGMFFAGSYAAYGKIMEEFFN